MAASQSKALRETLRQALGPAVERKVWSSNVESLLPLTFNDVDLEAVMPAVLYMLRWGARRGTGRFVTTFARTNDESGSITALDIADKLLETTNSFSLDPAVTHATQQTIIANLVSGLCFDNRKSKLGVDQPIQRVYPVHYLASKFDLPDRVANLRGVPELVVGILTSYGSHKIVQESKPGLLRSVRQDFDTVQTRLLLSIYAGAIQVDEQDSRNATNRANPNEVLDEWRASTLGIDQLLLIRASQCLDRFPPSQGSSGHNWQPRLPVTERQNKFFEQDLRDFLRYFAADLPRSALNRSIEAIIGVNLFAILTSFCNIMNHWLESGTVLNENQQNPLKILVDCSSGKDRDLRDRAEASFSSVRNRYLASALPIKVFQLINAFAENSKGEDFPSGETAQPVDLLIAAGEVLLQRTGERLRRRLEDASDDLRNLLLDDREYDTLAIGLANPADLPVTALARTIIAMMGPKTVEGYMSQMLESALGTDGTRGTGMLAKRNTQRSRDGNTRSYRQERSLRMPDSVLETLAHRLLVERSYYSNERLNVRDFITELSNRYGLCIDQIDDFPVDTELLHRNREYFEERLRALGLLEGVNDAENMKRIRLRFKLSDGYEQILPEETQ